jgi:hypothetical protein
MAVVALMMLLIAQVASATSASASQPAMQMDLSSPKAAAKSLFKAVAAGDREAVRSALYADDEPQRELIAAMADLIINGKQLGDAAKQQFGQAGDPIGRGMLDPRELTRLDDAKVDEAGNTATVALADSGRNHPMSFRRQGGKWTLIVTDFGGALPANVAKQTHLIRMMADAMETSTQEISSGKYKTPDAAITGIQRRLHEVMLVFTHPATTRATTGQSTTNRSEFPQRE